MDTIENTADIIDSREVIARIDYLSGEETLDEDENTELAALTALAEEGSEYSDWQYGETLIRESHFENYAKELAEDIGAVRKDLSWPLCHIDWEAAANALLEDYAEVRFSGVIYYIRNS